MKHQLLAASALAMVAAAPAFAQTAGTTSAQNTAPTNGPGLEATSAQTQGAEQNVGIQDIVVTAQRQSQRLQDVPIAVSAFTADNLEKQQIVNPTVLQQTLPNVTFTKTNFTSSSFTIRGIGDLCVGVTCDSATAIHINDMPLLNTRLFETEFLDLERVEVLRGPQGTLFGRNATSGVVNFITAKPDLSAVRAAGEFEYGNYDSKRARAMFNLPISSTIGIRVAGQYLNRDGYTYNQFNNSRIDGRKVYSIRGTLSWEPSSDTRVDLIGYYFHERDNRSRIQKQLCSRDNTGILGCRPDGLGYGVVNANSQLTTIFSSQQTINISLSQAGLGALIPLYAGLTTGSVYSAADGYSGATNPADPRVVNLDFNPRYYAEEEQYMIKVFHDFGKVSFNFTGGYSRNAVNSEEDYNLAVASFPTSVLTTLNNYANGAAGPAYAAVFTPYRNALIPNGPTGGYCVSAADPNNVGVFGGNSAGCFSTPQDFDESSQTVEQYSAEAHIDSKFDGPFNFLLGGIYVDSKTHNNSYYVNAFALDYTSALLGSIATLGNRLAGNTAFPVVDRGTPFFRSNTQRYELKSYGIFGETYFEFSSKLKLTAGLRYNHDHKDVQARASLYSDANSAAVYVPVGATNLTQAINYSTADYDAFTAGVQPYALGSVSYSRLTGRAVLDYRITPNNLIYASYSRGYKSGGFNPPLSPSFGVPITFDPESIDSFEIGSKNTFGGLRLNLTAFYYNYKGLQLSRIVSRTAVNDNVSAHIYGVEAEAIISPVRALVVNANFSYLHSRVSSDKFLADTRDPSGGRADAVIIKDLTNAANCAVVPNTAGSPLAQGFVGAVNAGLGLAAPVAVPGTNATGAFSICSALAAQATATGTPVTVLGSGVAVNIRNNQLPNAPTYKASVGVQYTADIGRWTIVPRADLNYTGGSYASVFNTNVDRIRGYEVVNAQVQLNAPDDRFYVRGFVQNLTNNNAVTGQYVGDQSSGLYTNAFTIEPRRYGAAVGFKF